MSQAPTLGPVDEVVDFFSRGPTSAQLTQQEERELDQMILLDDIVSLIRARAERRLQYPSR
jgi:hypothetical protein